MQEEQESLTKDLKREANSLSRGTECTLTVEEAEVEKSVICVLKRSKRFLICGTTTLWV